MRRGSVGAVRTVAITEQLAEELRLRSTRGALVWQMSRDSSAYDAGIRPGDVIESVNGQPVDDPNAFNRAVADAQIGSTATMVVRREGKTTELKVAIERARNQQGQQQHAAAHVEARWGLAASGSGSLPAARSRRPGRSSPRSRADRPSSRVTPVPAFTLPRGFYARSALDVARDLIGKRLVHLSPTVAPAA